MALTGPCRQRQNDHPGVNPVLKNIYRPENRSAENLVKLGKPLVEAIKNLVRHSSSRIG